jgi:AcrR family transcriptional regulator
LRVNPEKKEEKERVTHALLRSTLRLAAAHGFASLGLREVARAADIAPTSFYRHFADMEALGLALIDELVGRFMRDAVARAEASVGGMAEELDALTNHVLSAVISDPELLRFVLAERVGAIPSFRAALERQLAVLSDAVRGAIDEERAADALATPAYVADAAVVLLFEAAGKALDRGVEHVPELRERLLSQLRLLTPRSP